MYKSKQGTKFYTCGCGTWYPSLSEGKNRNWTDFENKAPKGNIYAYETYKVFEVKVKLKGMW